MADEGTALGMVETRGLVGAIEAADAMVKAAHVKLIGKEFAEGGLVLIKVLGETGAVRASVQAGAAAAERVGELVSTHMIPRPDTQVHGILFNGEPEPGQSTKSTEEKNFNSETESSIVEELNNMTVEDLRQYARNLKDFPVKGRELAKLNRSQLIEILSSHLQK